MPLARGHIEFMAQDDFVLHTISDSLLHVRDDGDVPLTDAPGRPGWQVVNRRYEPRNDRTLFQYEPVI